MKWNEIYDPKGEAQIRATFGTVRRFYEPEQVQKLINENGLKGMIEAVNKHLIDKNIYDGLMLLEAKDKKILIEFKGTIETDLG